MVDFEGGVSTPRDLTRRADEAAIDMHHHTNLTDQEARQAGAAMQAKQQQQQQAQAVSEVPAQQAEPQHSTSCGCCDSKTVPFYGSTRLHVRGRLTHTHAP